MANILDYMKRTPPETAREANTKSGRNAIRKEMREHGAFLKSAKETAEKMADANTVKEINKDIDFFCKWFIKFGIKDEE